MKAKITIDFKGNAKVFAKDFNIKTSDFYSLEIHPYIGKRDFDSFELIFSNIKDGNINWGSENIDSTKDSCLGNLTINGTFIQDIDSSELEEALIDEETQFYIQYKSGTVYILVDENAKDEWDRTRSLVLKENGGFQKLKLTLTLDTN